MMRSARMKRGLVPLVAVSGVAGALAVAACRGSTAPGLVTRTTAELRFLRPAPGAPPLLTTQASFYAVRGQTREIRLFYAPPAGSGVSTGPEFLHFQVPAGALDRRPDGSSFAPGDSTLITLTVTDPTRFIVDFEPTGLHFSATVPALLRFDYTEINPDVDRDGVVNAADTTLLRQMAVWQQEQPGGLWTRQPSVVTAQVTACDATISGFSNYVLAY